jgi:NAD(P)-dependent dehydrogenase (short-subunit alcohol dehydrogenase family)
VNNASAPYRPGEPLEHWADTAQTDFLGAMYGTRLAIDAMRRAGGGAIVNIRSTSTLAHGRTKSGGSAIYDAAKAGILRLTTGLAWLGAKERIRVNCLVPHWIETPEVAEFYYSASPEERAAYGAPGRLLPLDRVAGAVLRLVEDDALAGRLMVWWSDEDEPKLIPWGDPGFAGSLSAVG